MAWRLRHQRSRCESCWGPAGVLCCISLSLLSCRLSVGPVQLSHKKLNHHQLRWQQEIAVHASTCCQHRHVYRKHPIGVTKSTNIIFFGFGLLVKIFDITNTQSVQSTLFSFSFFFFVCTVYHYITVYLFINI